MKEKMILFAESDNDSESGIHLFLVPERWEFLPSDECIKLETVDVYYEASVNTTSEALRLKAIETLRDKQQRVIAEAEKKRAELEKKIEALLLLTYNQEEVS